VSAAGSLYLFPVLDLALPLKVMTANGKNGRKAAFNVPFRTAFEINAMARGGAPPVDRGL
jgi:hypothetical protein